MLKAGFHRAALRSYTGFKSSPYTEGALFYGEKLIIGQARETIISQAESVAEPLKEMACKPGGT
jgi:hypothetical protein